MYYLKSRYYDPVVCRFINADKFASTGQGIIGHNMYAYCNNNPVNFSDTSGSKMDCCILVSDGGGERRVIMYNVPLYSQGDLPLCWAYNEVMIISYKNNTVFTQKQADVVARIIAMCYAVAHKSGKWKGGGSPTNLGEKLQANSIEELYYLLKDYGPLFAVYENTYDPNHKEERIGHSVIVTGVDLDRGLVFTNNPQYIQGEQIFYDFLNSYMKKDGPSIDRHLVSLYSFK